MDKRQIALQQWLTNTCQLGNMTLHQLPGDASFRRYFRVKHEQGILIAMDAPPPRENCVPFVAISHALRAEGLLCPEIFHADLENGFLAITDFGDKQFLQVLNQNNAEQLYLLALESLKTLKNCSNVPGWTLPFFTSDFMYQELLLFQEWFLEKFLKLDLKKADSNLLAKNFLLLAESAAEQPQVFMHRDYHSANLMLLPDDRVGILDFQDAFIGPVTYDLVSLLRDCYIDWPEDFVNQLALDYLQSLHFGVSHHELIRWFDWMGMQRHFKALLTFSRKWLRDQNPHYLQYIPRTLNYIEKTVARYEVFHSLHLFLKESVLPAMEKVPLCVE